MQDSLQILAKLPEAEREAVAERLAEEYIKKEKEEEKRKDAENIAGNQKQNTEMPMQPPFANQRQNLQGDQGWYFSNPNTVVQGKNAFFRKWGKRRNTDYWRWSDKSTLAMDGDMPEELLFLYLYSFE